MAYTAAPFSRPYSQPLQYPSVSTLVNRRPTGPSMALPESSPSPSRSPRKPQADPYLYACSLCRKEFPPPCYTIGFESRIVCLECWKWMYNVSICWACGEMVFSKTDSVRFGWCWWHWSCVSCIVCRVTVAQPWLNLICFMMY